MLQVYPEALPPPLLAMALGHAQDVMQQSAPDEIIGRDGKTSSNDPYLERWHLLRSGGGHIYLHRFLRSDPEDLHDHPWPNCSIVLHGRYVENSWSLDGSRRETRNPRDIVVRAPEDRHAIVGVQPGTVTLFITGQKVREWGFWMGGTFVHHREYRARKNRQEAA